MAAIALMLSSTYHQRRWNSGAGPASTASRRPSTSLARWPLAVCGAMRAWNASWSRSARGCPSALARGTPTSAATAVCKPATSRIVRRVRRPRKDDATAANETSPSHTVRCARTAVTQIKRGSMFVARPSISRRCSPCPMAARAQRARWWCGLIARRAASRLAAPDDRMLKDVGSRRWREIAAVLARIARAAPAWRAWGTRRMRIDRTAREPSFDGAPKDHRRPCRRPAPRRRHRRAGRSAP